MAGVVIVLPLLRPEGLRLRSVPMVLMPPIKLPEVQQMVATRSAAASSGAVAATVPQVVDVLRPGRIPTTLDVADGSPVLAHIAMADGGVPAGIALGDSGGGGAVRVVVARPMEKPMRISAGVSAGMLLTPIRPVYPTIAKAARVEGTVIVEAVISKAGGIESLHVVSGPEMLRGSAMEAIQGARYRPFLLNGAATEVQTVITVNFRLGS